MNILSRRAQNLIWSLLYFFSVSANVVAVELANDDPDGTKTYQISAIQLIDPWIKSTIGAHHLKLFFEFRNHGAKADRLIAASSALTTEPSQFFAVATGQKPAGDRSEIAAIDIPTGERSFELSENGYYIQLNGLSRPVVMGSSVPIVLRFQLAGLIEMDVPVRFHSPKLHQRIKDAINKGDIKVLKRLRSE